MDASSDIATENRRLFFIHERKAAYPDIIAYKAYFSSKFSIAELSRLEAASDSSIGRSVCWHMMGFYPRRLPAGFVIHDYRSLSVGFARRLKDRIKGALNHRPDLRIFQNREIQEALSIRDGVPEIMLPMGVPDRIVNYRHERATEKLGDYCYIGSMLPERRMDLMIDSFIRRFGARKSLWLFGTPDRALQNRYASNSNIVFPGAFPQDELFEKLYRFEACVCYFPNHYPHVLQTPTKLLEYAALGLRIIANDHPQSRISASQYGIECLWGEARDMFAAAPETSNWADNGALDPTPMLWRNVIGVSGINEIFENMVQSG